MFRRVRYALGWLLFGIYLLGNTPAMEMLKLPVLFEHYREHRVAQADMGFWEYVSLHYFSGITYDADYACDMQLPFKSISLVYVFLFALQPPVEAAWALTLPDDVTDKSDLPPVLGILLSPYLGTPAQPPEA